MLDDFSVLCSICYLRDGYSEHPSDVLSFISGSRMLRRAVSEMSFSYSFFLCVALIREYTGMISQRLKVVFCTKESRGIKASGPSGLLGRLHVV